MLSKDNIKNESDSLIELLAAQCADLEKLLALAREETKAVEDGKFLTILEIVSDREKIGKRLEASQQQIAEIRTSLGESNELVRRNRVAEGIIEMAKMTIQQDLRTKLLLSDVRDNSKEEIKKLENGNRGTDAYLRENTRGLAYDQSF